MSSQELARAADATGPAASVATLTEAGISASSGASTSPGPNGLPTHCEVPAWLEYGVSAMAVLPASEACR